MDGYGKARYSIEDHCGLQAMSLNVPQVVDHPNRLPFSGILVRLDVSSDHPVGGADGHRTLIPLAVAEAALPSLLGMAVDFKPALDGHDRTAKIGVITEATIEGGAVHIKGFFYASDFPEVIRRIRTERERLGFSYEADARVKDSKGDPWIVDWLVFKGAAVLYKDMAAYTTTSLAASSAATALKADEENAKMEELLKTLSEQVVGLSGSIEKIGQRVEVIESKSMMDCRSMMDSTSVEAGATHDKVKVHVVSLRACAAAMEAAGIGTHKTQGHVNVLRHMANEMEAEAIRGNLPHIYRDHDFIGGNVEAAAGRILEVGDQMTENLRKQVEMLAASLDDANTRLTDLQAKAFNAAAAPERKTITPEIAALLRKTGLSAEAEKGELNVEQVDKTLEAAGVKDTRKRFEAKLKLMDAGLLPLAPEGRRG